MHFDSRTQQALRAVGLDRGDIREASKLVTEAVAADAEDLRAFFDERETVHSDMEKAHTTSDVHEHTVEFFDCYTHGSDLRGYLRFDSWGVPVEGGRVLSDEKVELTLGPTIHDRVRFATDPELL
jgi:hypothetical protein